MADVDMRSVSKSFGDNEVIHSVDLQVEDNEFMVFVGPSGCGKSTLLRLIAGLEDVNQGEISIGGERVEHLPPAKRGIAMVFQSYALYPHMTVFENMSFGLRLAKAKKDFIQQRVQEAADVLQITELLQRKPKELSGGQRQRVAIGRAIVREPKVFLFDEPLSNLDAKLRVQMRIELTKLHQKLNATMIYVTHDQVEAMTMGHRLAVMNKGEVVQLDPPEKVFNEPANRFVAEFIGSPPMNFLDVEVAEENFQKILKSDAFDMVLPETWYSISESKAILGFRPHDARLVAEGGVSGRVTVVETLGAEKLVYLKVGKNSLSILVPATEKIRSGDQLRFDLNQDALHLFNREDEKRIVSSKQS